MLGLAASLLCSLQASACAPWVHASEEVIPLKEQLQVSAVGLRTDMLLIPITWIQAWSLV